MPEQPLAADSALSFGRLLPVLLLQLAVSFGFSLFFLFPAYLTRVLHADAAEIGAVTAAPLVAAVVVTPLVGAAIDRFGRKLPVSVGGLLVVTSSLALAHVDRVGPSLFALRALQGVGFVLGFNGAAACMADAAPPERLGRAMGWLGAASLLMNAAAPAVGERVADGASWFRLFALAAVAGVASIAAVSLTRSPWPSTVTLSANSGGTVSVWVGPFMNGAAYGTLITFALPLALERGAARVSSYLVGYTAGALLVRIVCAGLADELGHRRVARASLALLGGVAVSTAALTPRWVVVFGAGFGVAHGFLYPALAAMAAHGTPPERRGRVLSRFAAAFNAGAGSAVFGAGWLASSFGYASALLCVGGLTLLSSALLRGSAPHGSQQALR